MIKPALQPPQVMPSVYGPPPRKVRAADLPGMVSLGVRELFPGLAPGLLQGQGVEDVALAAKQALDGVDLSMIRPEDTVNILSSEHGFYILEGLHYREMLKVLGNEVRRRTGCRNLRHRVASGVTLKESEEIKTWFDLERYFDAPVASMTPWDRGLPIETEIGTLYGLAKAYDADWIIHASHDEPRDLYFYRMMDRHIKAFAMSYARYETRAVYHGNFFSRSANILQRAMFDAPLVQDRFALACIMRSTPAGITGVDADNDLYRLDRSIVTDLLRDYGKMLRLFGEMDECIAVLDAGRLMYYLHAGGICFGSVENAEYDPFDLSSPAAVWYQDVMARLSRGEVNGLGRIMMVHPAIKAVVVNQAWPGLPISDLPLSVPTIVVGRDMADLLRNDPTNPSFMDMAVTADSLEAAMGFAYRVAGTDKVLAFDGSFGHVTASESLARFLLDKAQEVDRRVATELLPLWLKQRGIQPPAA
ncbi:MAG: hypothetical protein KKB20_09600 [Proteobacteria bacterium]|nr:hypothetical protein [Pseudomonadota bacterium]